MDTIIIILQALLGIAFLFFGILKIVGVKAMRENFAAWGYPQWFRVITGVAEVIGGAALLASIWAPPLAAFAGIWVVLILIGAVFTEVFRSRQRVGWIFPTVLLILALGIVYTRPLGLQLLAIMQPDDLPVAPVPSHELAAYPPGSFLEGIALDRQGNIYFTNTTGADFSTFDFSTAQGEIIRRTPDGEEATFASLPFGSVAGVLVLDADETLYLTVAAPTNPDAHGVWRFTPSGEGYLFAAMQLDAQPNGITVGPDGNLYIADSSLGAVWRIDTANGAVEQWILHAQLGRRPFLGLFPGANGLEFWQNDLYVAVSDRGHIVRIPLLADGRAGEPTIFVTGVPTDDFAFDGQGNLYATTHPFDTIVRVTPDGERTVIATEAEGVIGPTDAAFGTLPGDELSLYVVTDGGLFVQRPDLRPALVRLDIGAMEVGEIR